MTEKQYFNDTLTVYVKDGETPSVREFDIKNGANAGKKGKALTFRGFHENYKRTDDGKFEKTGTDWYKVTCYDRAAEHLLPFIQDGLRLIVHGEVTEFTYKNKEGQDVKGKEIRLYKAGADLLQKGLESIQFKKPEKAAEAKAQA